MLQLNLLSGKMAGARWEARRFPVRIGRAATSDLQLEEDGVWDQHLELDFNPAEGFVLATRPGALARVNGQPVQHAVLRNGDRLELGSAKIQFWLGDTRQRGLQIREWFVWTLVVATSLGQIALVYWLLR
jgi:pSer/pThr/pTyr-binding forkhead associated (FHA) protein